MPDQQVVARLSHLWKKLQDNSDALNKSVSDRSESAAIASSEIIMSPVFKQSNVSESMLSEDLPMTNEIQQTWNFVNTLMSSPGKNIGIDVFQQDIVPSASPPGCTCGEGCDCAGCCEECICASAAEGGSRCQCADGEECTCFAQTVLDAPIDAPIDTPIDTPINVSEAGSDMSTISMNSEPQGEKEMLSLSAVPMRPIYEEIRPAINQFVQNNVNRVFKSVKNVALAPEIEARLRHFPELAPIAHECFQVTDKGKVRLQMWPIYERFAEAFMSNLDQADRKTYWEVRKDLLRPFKSVPKTQPLASSTLRTRADQLTQKFDFRQDHLAELSEIAYSENVVTPQADCMKFFQGDMLDAYNK